MDTDMAYIDLFTFSDTCHLFFHKNNPLLLISSEIVIPLLYTATISILLKSLKPISAIGRSLNLLKEGDFNITMITTGNKDVDNIIDVYNSMILGLREERLSVREKNHFLDLLIESSPLGIVMLDLDDRIIEINKSGLRCLGLAQGSFNGKYLYELTSSLGPEIAKINYEEKQMLVLADGQKYLCRKLFLWIMDLSILFILLKSSLKRSEKRKGRRMEN